MEMTHFRMHNLVTTLLPPGADMCVAILCPSGTCCGPPTVTTTLVVLPRPEVDFGVPALHAILEQVRSLAEEKPVDLLVPTHSDSHYRELRSVLESEMGPATSNLA